MISRRFDAIHSCCLALPRNILVWDTHEHACREVTQKRTAHTQEVHPYSAFPIERLEAAVTAVPWTASLWSTGSWRSLAPRTASGQPADTPMHLPACPAAAHAVHP